MIAMFSFVVAVLMPWGIGGTIIWFFLKARNGRLAFSVGAGYVLGWFLVTTGLRIYSYLGFPFNIYEFIIIELFALVLLFFVLRTKNNAMNKTCFGGRSSNLTYFISIFIISLLLFRWGLTLIDLLSKPVFPWDGWQSWSVKAKIFFYHQGIPPLVYEAYPFWEVSDQGVVPVSGARHPYFISLIQTYMAMAWGGWNDSVVNLPWLGLSVALASTVLGGMRYLGFGFILSLLAGYAITSLPIIDAHVSLGAYADLWVGVSLLIAVFLLGIFWTTRERGAIFLLLLFLLIVYLTKNTAFIFLFVILSVILWRILGGTIYFVGLLVLVSSFCLLISSKWQPGFELGRGLWRIFSTSISEKLLGYNPVFNQVLQEWGVLDNWHYMFVVSLASMIILVFQRKTKGFSVFMMLVVAASSVFLIMLLATFFTTKMSETSFVGYFNRVSLYMIPVFFMGAVGAFQLVYKK